MTLVVIAAVAQNGVIGRAGQLPWHLPEDLKRFRALTRGHAIIMGRKTFESIGRPLPDRLNIVVTSQADWMHAGVTRVPSFAAAVACAEGAGYSLVFAIGGEGIFREALVDADRVELTEIFADVRGDVFFPKWERKDYDEIQRVPGEESHHTAGFRYDFVTYARGSNSSAD